MKKIARFFAGVVSELKKVRWPDFKTMVKYSTATLIFVIFLSLFFRAIDILVAFIRTLV